MSPRVAVVIPALDEEATIRAVVESVLPHGLDVIVIDDGSRDGTRAALEGLAVTLIVHPQRLGKGAALLDGFRLALERGCDGVISMDGDGQHAAADIPRLVAAHRAAPARCCCARARWGARSSRACATSPTTSPISGTGGRQGCRSPIRSAASGSIRAR